MDLRSMQKAVYQNKLDHGFNVTNVEKEFCLLHGEIAEAYSAYLRKEPHLGEELADAAIYLLGLSEILGIDLKDEIERKMAINQNRRYQVIDGVLTRMDDEA